MKKHKFWTFGFFLSFFSTSPASSQGYVQIRRNGTFLNPVEESNFWSQHPPGKPDWLVNVPDDSFFRPSREILIPQFTNLQAPSNSVETPPETLKKLVEEGKEQVAKDNDWNHHYVPSEPVEFHLRGKKTKKNRHRSRNRQRISNRQNIECAGTCRNALSCMFVGFRADKTVSENACPGMMNVCCMRWGSPSSASQAQSTPVPRRKRQRAKGGRALGGLFTPYYTSAGNDDIDNSIPSSTGGESLLDLASTTVSSGLASIFLTDPTDRNCGLSKNAQRKIMGGLDAGYGQFPWTAYIKVRGPGIDKVCSGTMIDRQWVLTAGHCTQYCVGYPECSREISQSEITYKVIMGEYDQSYDEEYPPDTYLVVEVHRHPQYQNVMRYRDNGVLESEPRFDVALMRLDRIARMAPNVGRVCLPRLNAPTLTPPDTQATVVGWGRLGSQENDPHSNVLQAVTVPVLGDEQCQYETGLPLYSDQLCAGGTYTEESACPGDSGGGLQVQDDDDRWTLVGIVSNGPSVCGLQPVVFHKVENSLDWILKTMQYKKYSTP